ncbi:MAG: LuxR C-terminal-related transcriptional regulator [Coriobacteriia bacterium]
MNYLVTKTTPPILRSRLVPWPRLNQKLWAGTERKLTLLTAVAGSGKTTCLAAFSNTLAKSGWHTAWLSLEEQDNDPRRFWMYFFAAINGMDPSLHLVFDPALCGWWDRDCLYLEEPLNRVAGADFAFYLILDDYHEIIAEPIHAGLMYWIEHMPANMHIAIASRTTPPLPLSRLRARDDLVEIRSRDLFFDLSGTVDFLRRVKELDVSQDDARVLQELTNGWVAGLQLATVSIQTEGGMQHLADWLSRGNRRMEEFLIDEVLGRQSDRVQEFLLRTSILNRLSASLCEAVTGDRDSREILETLLRADLFLTPLDNRGEWYRYHALFSDVLKDHLLKSEPEIVPALFLRASTWSEQNGMIGAAISNALSAGDGERAIRLLEHNLPALLRKFEGTRLIGWLAGLPDELCADNLSYLLLSAWANFIAAHTDKSKACLRRARRLIDATGASIEPEKLDGFEDLMATIEACVLSLEGNHSEGIELSKRTLESLSEAHQWLRIPLLHNLAESYERVGDISAAAEAFLAAKASSAALDAAQTLEVFSTYELGWIYLIQGQLRLASKTWKNAVEALDHGSSRPSWPSGLLHIGLGRLSILQNELEAANQHVARGLGMLAVADNADCYIEGQIALAYLHLATGSVTDAVEIIRYASHLARSMVIPRGIRWKALVCEAHCALAGHDVSQAKRAADVLDREVPSDDRYYRLRLRLIEASILKEVDVPTRRLSLLDDVLAEVDKTEFLNVRLEAMIARADCLERLGQTANALSQLSQAVDIGEPEGYIRPFMDGGTAIGRLLYKMLYDPTGGLASSPSCRKKALYCTKLIEALQSSELRAPADTPTGTVRLSEREMEVLDLMKAGMSNREIAEHLFISLSTVKTHVKAIYEKTGVHDRAAASQF